MNRQFAEQAGLVAPAGHRSEREADRVARRAVRQAGAGPVRTRAHGGRLDDDTRGRMERALGADLSAVRVHTGRAVDEVGDLLQAHAFTIGDDVYVRRAAYRPGTRAGDELLAHELAHTLQPTPATWVSLKRRRKHLDFVRMKRQDVRWGRAVKKALGMQVAPDPYGHGTYGHWWTEIGDLDPTKAPDAQWHADESYGWWPAGGVRGVQATLRGVPGFVNQGGGRQDPHHNEPAPVEFHPVMEVDDNADYVAVRNKVTQDIRSFAFDFHGIWNWRLGWGQNCQTFQKALKKRIGLHYTKSKDWLADPRPAQEAARRAAEAAGVAKETTHTFELVGYLEVYERPEGQGQRLNRVGNLRDGETIGVTGRTTPFRWPSGLTENLVEVVWEGTKFWASEEDFDRVLGQPYPAGEGTEQSYEGIGRNTQQVRDSW
jgi:hypothetical protein